ncbi:MAG: hypothetical protein R3E50_15235 [Halioglobus sp.]
MSRYLLIAAACILPWLETAVADDIDAYLPRGHGSVYLQVVMDLGNTDLDGVICTFGVDCGPPFMTVAAHGHLSDMYTSGEAVTAPGVFKAVLAAVLEHTQFDDFYLSLLISNHQDNQSSTVAMARGGGTLLQGYRLLGRHRATYLDTLKMTPILGAGDAHELQPRETFFEWVRYLRGETVLLGQNTRGNFGVQDPLPDYAADIIANGRYVAPFPTVPQCLELYSILFTLGTAKSDADLVP